jgi:hypothetical protein
MNGRNPPACARAAGRCSTTIVGKAMTKDREARYPTWEDFAHDLAQAVRNRQLLIPRAEICRNREIRTLRALPFFSDFNDVEIWEVLRFSPTGSALRRARRSCAKAKPAIFFCFLTAGELKVGKGKKTLSVLRKGDCFGEMAVISRQAQVRSADITALTIADIVTVRGEALQRASESCRMHFYQGFLGVLAARLSLANQRLADF